MTTIVRVDMAFHKILSTGQKCLWACLFTIKCFQLSSFSEARCSTPRYFVWLVWTYHTHHSKDTCCSRLFRKINYGNRLASVKNSCHSTASKTCLIVRYMNNLLSLSPLPKIVQVTIHFACPWKYKTVTTLSLKTICSKFLFPIVE